MAEKLETGVAEDRSQTAQGREEEAEGVPGETLQRKIEQHGRERG
jgi:hypothetical protein